MNFRTLLKRVFGKKNPPAYVRPPLVPGFVAEPRLESITRELAQNLSRTIGERLYGDGEGGEAFKKARAVCNDLLKRHGKELTVYLKPYIDLKADWSIVPTEEWHRWFVTYELEKYAKGSSE